MKKSLLCFVCIGLSLLGFVTIVHAQWGSVAFPYADTPVGNDISSVGQTEDLSAITAQGTVNSQNTILNGLLEIFGFSTPEYEGIPKALIYVRFIINLLLGLVSFIALVIIIYSFYLMFFTEDSKGMEQVKKNLTGVAIALVVLGLSWFIVSFIFDFYQSNLLNA